MAEKSEKDLLIERLTKMNVDFHPNNSVDTLRKKLADALNEDENSGNEPEGDTTETKGEEKPLTKGQQKALLKKEAAKLVRVRVSCMNPNKKEWEGEMFTVGNSSIGSFRKYVPFNNDEGWHIPNILYKHLKERQCQIFVNAKDDRGNKIRKGKLIKEFSVEKLPDLTEEEISELAKKQAMANSID